MSSDLAVREALKRTSVSISGSVRLAGRLVYHAGKATLDEEQRAAALRDAYYSGLYLAGVGEDGILRTGLAPIPGPATGDFDQQLREAIEPYGVEEGWRVEHMSLDRAQIVRAGLRLSVARSELDQDAVVGDSLSLRLPSGLPALSPGYLMTVGITPFHLREEDLVVRWYWHLMPEGGPMLLREFTYRANEREVPYRLKVLTDPVTYVRCDAGVLYTRRSDLAVVQEMLKSIHAKLEGQLRMSTPLWAKRMATGLAVAESPPGTESFGQHRCRLLADAVLAVRLRRMRAGAAEAEVLAQLGAAGLGSSTSHLRSRGADPYQVFSSLRAFTPSRRPALPDGVHAASERIAAAICEDALWHQDRCTWLSKVIAISDKAVKTIGADLYSGAAGLAWFLAEFARQSGDRHVRRAALGAWKQAVSRAAELDVARQYGLYSGMTGIAVIGARIALLLNDESIDNESRAIAEAVWRVSDDELAAIEPDRLSGTAGLLAGALLLDEAWNDPRALAAALRFGESLLSRAVEYRGSLTWPSPRSPKRQALTGFSHGASGIALALAELGFVSGLKTFNDAGAKGFAYEDHHYNARFRNWPDFRNKRRSYASAWCHGAPGIALAKIKANRFLSAPVVHQQDLITDALSTTQKQIQAGLHGGRDWTLCHGLLGMAEIAQCGGHHLAVGELLNDTTGAGIRHDLSGGWPTSGGPREPTLMCGLSGIGMFLLRRIVPQTPSPVAIGIGEGFYRLAN